MEEISIGWSVAINIGSVLGGVILLIWYLRGWQARTDQRLNQSESDHDETKTNIKELDRKVNNVFGAVQRIEGFLQNGYKSKQPPSHASHADRVM